MKKRQIKKNSKKRLNEWNKFIKEFCRRRGMPNYWIEQYIPLYIVTINCTRLTCPPIGSGHGYI